MYNNSYIITLVKVTRDRSYTMYHNFVNVQPYVNLYNLKNQTFGCPSILDLFNALMDTDMDHLPEHYILKMNKKLLELLNLDGEYFKEAKKIISKQSYNSGFDDGYREGYESAVQQMYEDC